MKFLNNLDLSGKKKAAGIAIIIVIAATIAAVYVGFFRNNSDPGTVIYNYSDQTERRIANEVKSFLSLYLDLPENVSAQAADEAVQNYRIILQSDVDVVNDEHTSLIKKRMREALVTLLDTDMAASLTDDDLDGLSSGIAEIIWNAILSQIETVSTVTDYEKEYLYLSESIQKQINALEDQKMKITIHANIKNDPDISSVEAEIDTDSLLNAIDGMSDEELQKLAESFGLSMEDLQKLLNTYNNNLNKELENKITELERELLTKVTSEIQKNYGKVEDGKNGMNGKNGKDGSDGKDGNDGKDGSNGKTTYIAYADDINGTGFSLTPTETSRYVGTCITDDAAAPKDYAAYSNWQIYRTYIITTTVDEYNVTTVHIN
ncbi:MAG: hypothetical protein HFI48_16675 [Lachnospiraceae bacterium]|nr:hypothetical protein [Lachnospiraceae bacterium]